MRDPTPLDEILKTAVQDGVEGALADELREIVAKETRRTLRDHEDQLTVVVRSAVAEAFASLLGPGAKR